MNQILGFLVTHLSWIWSDARYRIAGSQVSTSNGGDALLVIESATLRMQLNRDRGQCSSIVRGDDRAAEALVLESTVRGTESALRLIPVIR